MNSRNKIKYFNKYFLNILIGTLLLASQPCSALAAAIANNQNYATLSIKLSSPTVTQGSTIDATILVSSGTNKAVSAQACLSYDTNLIKLVNINTTSSFLSYLAPNGESDCKANELQISRFGSGQKGSSLTLATVSFKALQPAGEAKITFDTSSSFIKDDVTLDNQGNSANVLNSATDSSITLKPVPAAPASANPSSPKPTGGNQPAVTATPGPQAISNTVKPITAQKSTTKSSNATIPLTIAAILLVLVGLVVYKKYKVIDLLKARINRQ